MKKCAICQKELPDNLAWISEAMRDKRYFCVEHAPDHALRVKDLSTPTGHTPGINGERKACNCQKWHQDGCFEGRDADEMGQAIEIVDCQHYEPFDDAQDKPLTCSHCGHTGQEVGLAWQHVGGYCDHRLIPQCINRLACWQRWERHQLAQIRR